MELIADILLVAGALGAGLYCFVLARRLKRFSDLEKGVGGAVSVLSAQADELKTSLDTARVSSDQSGAELKELTQRAEAVAQRLELMMASMHDIAPESQPDAKSVNPTPDNPENTPELAHKSNDQRSEKIETQDEVADLQEQIETTPEAEPTPKAPGGVMFFRHARGGAS